MFWIKYYKSGGEDVKSIQVIQEYFQKQNASMEFEHGIVHKQQMPLTEQVH